MANILAKFFGNYSKRELKRIQPLCDAVLALESKYAAMPEHELRGQTDVLRGRLAAGETLDGILPDAFAVCREATRRVLNQPHFPVQILGGIVLHQGRIAEMKTGEGKTQTVILPAYLNALSGKGVHVVTVNDYLARRDSEWMGKVYRYLGLSVGLIVHDLDNSARKAAYNADITYGTNNELGFDYLRDNMVIYKENKVQRGHSFAIVDEVDSILIDEARTPLIISGQGDKSTELYQQADRCAKTLRMVKVAELDDKADNDEIYADADYLVDEKAKTATLTPNGVRKVIAKVNNSNLVQLVRDGRLESVVSPRDITANRIVAYVRAVNASRDSGNVESLFQIVGGQVEVLEFHAGDEGAFLNVPLKDLRTKPGILIACLVRGGRAIIPGGMDSIQPRDGVLVVTKDHHLTALEDILAEA